MKVGFTGTRNGMSDAQVHVVVDLLEERLPDEVHHGDCIGADEMFHEICTKWMSKLPFTVGHPADRPDMRAHCAFDLELPEKPPLDRNADIVEASDILIATPDGPERVRGSGTWYTVRIARLKLKQIFIVDTYGRIEEENREYLRLDLGPFD